MDRFRRRTILAVTLVLAALVPGAAIAQQEPIHIDYYGETPTGGITGFSSTTPTTVSAGGKTYTSRLGSDTLWDYVYTISKTNTNQGPDIWAIAVPVQPDYIYCPTDWTYKWDSEITRFEYTDADGADLFYTTDPATSLVGRSAIVWDWNGTLGPQNKVAPSVGFFHIQTIQAPALNCWIIDGSVPGFEQVPGTEWSPSPEPASMALTSLMLLGVGWWRRKKTDN